MKTAIVYDRVNKWGGAERVLLALHELFPDAPLFTSLYSPAGAGWAGVFLRVIPSFLQKLPFIKNRHEYVAFLMPLAFESHNFAGYDLVISVTSEAAKGIITGPGTRHICYCLTPTRYLWSGHNVYFRNPLLKNIVRPIISYLRYWDTRAAQRPDVMIAISTEVKKRIKKYYNRDVKIIFPPVDVSSYRKNLLLGEPEAASRKFFDDTNVGYFLVVSRLVPYKRVDLVVDAFNKLQLPLVIVGSGSEEGKLKSKAKKNIKFVGQVSDRELAKYYTGCKALIFPQEEDLGLTAVEAGAFGKPVIAYKKGGILDIIKHGESGVFFEKQTVDDLVEAIESFHKLKFSATLITRNAKRFSKEKFEKEFVKLIGESGRGL